MDEDLKEALNMVKHLRATAWMAFDPDGNTEVLPLMPEELRDAFLEGAKLLAKHNFPDDMMNCDMYDMTGGLE